MEHEIVEEKNEFEQVQSNKLKFLAELYQQTNELLEENGTDLQEKLTIYGQIYEIMGDLMAFAIGQKELNYAYRKEVNAKAYLYKLEGKERDGKSTRKYTAKEREAVAELSTTKYRRQEARYAEEAKKWENRREAVLEQINIMKRRQDGLGALWEKANYTNGYA